MSIKIVSSDNLIEFPKDRFTVKEVLETFLKNAPKDEDSQDRILNSVIVYQTESGFAHAVLHGNGITNLIGSVEATKQFLLLELFGSGDISYDDDD